MHAMTIVEYAINNVPMAFKCNITRLNAIKLCKIIINLDLYRI